MKASLIKHAGLLSLLSLMSIVLWCTYSAIMVIFLVVLLIGMTAGAIVDHINKRK